MPFEIRACTLNSTNSLAILSCITMSNPDEHRQLPAEYSDQTGTTGTGLQNEVISLLNPAGNEDLRVPLLNLSAVRVRMDSLQRFITESVNGNRLISKDQMDMVSSEIVSAIQQTIVNGTALLAYSQQPSAEKSSIPSDQNASTSCPVNGNIRDQTRPVAEKLPEPSGPMMRITDPKVEVEDEEIEGGDDDDCEIIEVDAVELLAEHVHFCEICGKGFKRDANLRMHMRAHGNQYKTAEALAKPEKYAETTTKTRFSCPFQGCNRNRSHKKFKALKSIICVRNHFKRSHCPKMYSCNRCNKKNFSVLADLKSHLKHCGDAKWRCSCGTSFSRKDKLFGHMTLFEGHMPAVMDDVEKPKGGIVPMEEDGDGNGAAKRGELGVNGLDNGFFEGLLDGFGSMEEFCLQDMLGSSPGFNAGIIDEFYGL